MTATMLRGDCCVLMAAMDEASIDAIVCDPPYGLSAAPDIAEVLTAWLAGGEYVHSGAGFMGKAWDSFVPGPVTWAQAYRVLKPGGHVFAFFGTRTYDLGTIALRLAGFEIRDMIDWLYGSGFPKCGNLKPAHEPIVVARKPFKGSRAACVAAFGTGALNIEACRLAADERPLIVKIGGPNTPGSKVYGGGLSSSSRAQGKTTLGRLPANVVHDGSDEVVLGFPITTSGSRAAGEYASNRVVYHSGQTSSRDAFEGSTGSAARFFYCAKASKSDRREGLTRYLPRTRNRRKLYQQNRSRRWLDRAVNRHPTVKPEGLMRWLCRLANPGGGVILDPFAGSGSTGKAAVLEGFDFIGCELDAGYVATARARIAAAEARASAALERAA